MNLNAGILIIGSLYWDTNPSRKQWRQTRLGKDEKYRVWAPIRYGRKSRSRGDTYTMVLSHECLRPNQRGRAIVLPCATSVSSGQGLIREAEELWTAECSELTLKGAISATWGCVALLANSGRGIPQELLNAWTDRTKRENGYGEVTHADGEGSIVSPSGLLQIPWPELVNNNGPVSLDLLLATVTNPTLEGALSDYPSAEEVADTWNHAHPKHVEYFWKNRESGICTFQDELIMQHLSV